MFSQVSTPLRLAGLKVRCSAIELAPRGAHQWVSPPPEAYRLPPTDADCETTARLTDYFCATLFRWIGLSGGIAQRVGKAHAMHVITTTAPEQVPATDVADARLVWIGSDDRGIELEIVALDLEDAVVVIHVMPTSLRR